MLSTPQEVAAAILDLIPNYRRWMKNEEAKRNRHCLVGAVAYLRLEPQVEQSFGNRLCQVIRDQYPERFASSSHWATEAVIFNDHDRTRYGDVRLVLEKIAAG